MKEHAHEAQPNISAFETPLQRGTTYKRIKFTVAELNAARDEGEIWCTGPITNLDYPIKALDQRAKKEAQVSVSLFIEGIKA